MRPRVITFLISNIQNVNHEAHKDTGKFLKRIKDLTIAINFSHFHSYHIVYAMQHWDREGGRPPSLYLSNDWWYWVDIYTYKVT